MSVEENKAVVRSMYETDYSRDPDKVYEEIKVRYSPDFIGHNPWGDVDLEQYMKNSMAIQKAFSDSKLTLEDLVAEGDRVVQRYAMSGTHQSEFMGVPATGRKVKFGGVMILRFAGGKIAESWNYMDYVGLMQQLGVSPPGQ